MSRKDANNICCASNARLMLVLLPLLLLGGVVGLAWHGPSFSAPTTERPTASVSEGLSGYLQGVVGTLNDDPTIAARGLIGAVGNDPDNLLLRQRAMDAALMANQPAEALRLAKTLPANEMTALARLLVLADAAGQNDVKAARAALIQLKETASQLPLVTVLDAYLAAPETPADKLVLLLRPLQGWSSAWHGARLWLDAGNPKAARALLEQAVVTHPGAYLPVAQLRALQSPAKAAQTAALFSAATPGLAPLVEGVPSSARGTRTLANNVTAALLEFALQIWADGAPHVAQQILNLTPLLAADDPLLAPVVLHYQALLADSNGQTARAQELYQQLATRTDGFQLLATLRLTELQAQAATTLRARRQAAATSWQLASRHPSQTVLWQSALQLAMLAENYPQAAQISQHLLQNLPTEPSSTLPKRQAELYFAQGAAWAQAKEGLKAEANLKQAIALNPAHAEAMNYLGFLWVDENRNLEEAYSLLKRAHLLAPNNGAITDSVGWAYYRKADYATARHYLELAAQQEPGTPEILSHLGDTYFQLNQPDEARKLWQRALDFANQGASVPSGDFLHELRQKVRRGRL